MKGFIVTLLLLIGFTAFSQNESFQKEYSEEALNKIDRDDLYKDLLKIRRFNDSLNDLMKTDSVLNLYNRVSKDTSTNYGSWYLGMGPSFGDLGGLNEELKKAGLPIFNETSFGFTYFLSFAFSHNRFFHDFALGLTIGGKNEKDSLSLRYNTIDIINYKLGYAVLDAKRFAIIPYAGLDLQYSTIAIENKAKSIPDPSIDNYPDLFTTSLLSNTGLGTEFYKTELMLNYGIEVDYHIKYEKFGNGVILGLRAGGITPIFSADWRIEGEKYKRLPDLNLKESYVQLVLKFYWRNSKHPINPYSNPVFE